MNTSGTAAQGAKLRVGMIGCGFMARVHSHAWRTASRFDPTESAALSIINGAGLDEAREAAHSWGWRAVSVGPTFDDGLLVQQVLAAAAAASRSAAAGAEWVDVAPAHAAGSAEAVVVGR